jgi:DNA-binding HxlR family transcriptional regulator
VPIHSDYCPIARGVEILGDRWTPLVIRELMVGAEGFNDIHRGLPRMSRTLLAQRLRALERHGLVSREAAERGRPGRYVLTEAGWSITPIIWAMGQWAAEWVFDDPEDEDCDGLSLIWRLHQHAVADRLPPRRTLVHITLTGPGSAEGWLDVERPGMTVCSEEPRSARCSTPAPPSCTARPRWPATSRPGSTPPSSPPASSAAAAVGPKASA